ncbi:MAG: M48 family metalloprotease [Desulfobacterota bacterium]|nr:M48 family metalloprotease [Thermodesulfobacteriota bacterium]
MSRQPHLYFCYLLMLLLPFFHLLESPLAMTVEAEKKMGEKILLELEPRIERVRDLTLQAYIDRIGQTLVAQAGPTPFEITFSIIKGTDPNAFAIPGGHIFLTTGLLVSADSEQELAGVISHEIAHVMGRHVAQLIERSKRLNIASLAAIIAGALIGGGGKVTEAVAVTALAASEAFALKYTRDMEVEADQNALLYLNRAGYDPKGLVSFMNKIYKLSLTLGPGIPPYLSTHPAIGDRISLMENLLQAGTRAAGLPPYRVLESYRKIQAKAFVEEREPHVAVQHFQSLIDAHPGESDFHYGLGMAYRKTGRMDRAIEAFQAGLSLSSEDRCLLRELGITYFLSGKLDEACKALEAVQASSQTSGDRFEDWSGVYFLGRCYLEMGRLAQALASFQKVRGRFSDWPEVYHSLGSVYGRMGQKGLSHFYFGKHFKLRRDSRSALLHFRTALEGLERGSPERQEALREIQELSGTKK